MSQNPVVLPPTSSSYPERVAMAPVASQLPSISVFTQGLEPVTTQNALPVNVPRMEPLPQFSGRGAARLIAAAATALATRVELPGMLDLATAFAPPPEPSAEEVQNRAPVLNLHREIQRTQPAPTASCSSSSLALSDETRASLLQEIDPELIAAITEGPEDTSSRGSVSRISEVLATADLSGLPELPDLPEVPEHEEEPKAGSLREREEGEVTDTDDGKEKVIWSEQSTEVWSDEEDGGKTPATVVKKKAARDELDPHGDSEEPVDVVSVASTASPLSRPPSPAV